MDAHPNIVLVPGAWADGSSWSGVIERLQAHGHDVTAPQFSLTTAQDDRAIPPDAQRLFAKRMGATTVEIAASHVAMVSQPDAVVKLIEAAARPIAVAH